MRGKTKAKRFPFAITLALGTATYVLLLRKRLLRWGATNEQARCPLPGDSWSLIRIIKRPTRFQLAPPQKPSGPGSNRSDISALASTVMMP